jgi:selenium metabolism protein YedF
MLGRPCPIPVIEAKKALRSAAPGDTISVLVDNDIARQNLGKMAAGLGCDFRCETAPGGNILAHITVRKAACQVDGAETSGLVVSIGRDQMGGGSEDLGRSLMKSFIYALTELESPPEQLLFFNAGVKLTTEGSAALDDLEALTRKGVTISSCGACLNYYGLAEQLQTGSVTNMYAIVTAMSQAKRLINL